MSGAAHHELLESLRRQALTEFRRLLEAALTSAERLPDSLAGVGVVERLSDEVGRELAETWAARFRSSATVLGGRRRGGLSLLSEEGHEQQVRVERFVQLVARQCRNALQRLDARFRYLANEGEGVPRLSPVAPNFLAEAVQSGMETREIPSADMLWVFDRCLVALAPKLGNFYSALNTRLAEAGVLPDLEWQSLESDYRGPSGGRAGRGGPGSAPGAAGAEAGGEPAGADAAGASEAEALLKQLMDLLGAKTQPPGADGGAPAAGREGAASAQLWSQPEFLDLASQMQRAGAAPDPLQPLGQILQAGMREAAAEAGLPVERSLPPQAEQVLDLVGAIFDEILASPRLDPEERQQLRRLAIPFVKVAILDRKIFLQADHPARILLNRLVDALEDTEPDNAQDAALRKLAFESIEWTCAEFHSDLGLFQEQTQRLTGPMESHRHRVDLLVRRAADTQLGQERRELAQRRVNALLQRIAGGTALPRAFAEFLADSWRHHHFILLLREGSEAVVALEASESFARRLLEAGRDRDAKALAELRPQLEAVLATSGVHAGETSAYYDTLVQALTDSGAGILIETPDETSADLSGDEDLDPELIEAYRQPPPGLPLDWVEEDRHMALRLGWTSPLTGRHLLCNRRGQRVMLATPQELARWEKRGRLRPGRTQPAFDDAMMGAVLRLKLAREQAKAEAAGTEPV